jgi:deoxyribodipyrimidine photo-lyase
MNVAIMLFHRDLRIVDNTALNYLIKNKYKIIPLFILTPDQIDNNKLKSLNSIQFMMESLKDLDKALKGKLWVIHGDTIKTLSILKTKHNVSLVVYNRDYTPYALKRDKGINVWGKKNKCEVLSFEDILLTDTMMIKSQKDTFYKAFTQFYNKALTIKIRKVNNLEISNVLDSKYSVNGIQYAENKDIAVHGGRENGSLILKNIMKFKNYDDTRNIPSIETTHLSAHNKFGTVSIREVYVAFIKVDPKIEGLTKQLYWRDFYFYIGYHFPEMYDYAHLIKKTNKQIKWSDNADDLKKWKMGMTGFPFVDAGMRQMNKTGFMHNRVRMMVAMFLTKYLLINWKYGERYFTMKLVDIDRAQNVGNWNWSSSYGLDHTSFPRLMNPWTQSKKYDPDCKYIKKWIPELRDVANDKIHNWDREYTGSNYPKPMIDQKKAYKQFMIFYKIYFGKK